MGNGESTFLIISTNSAVFSPGDIIHGEVYVKLEENLQSSKLDINIEGLEEYKVKDGEVEHSGSFEIFNKSIILYDWKNGIAEKGDYIFPFNFKLPLHIPGSTSVSMNDLEASVKYCIKASISGGLSQSKELWVKSKNESRLTLKKNLVNEKFVVKNFCCIRKGVVDFQMMTDKFEYNCDDVMKIQFKGICDDIPRITCSVYRNIYVKDEDCSKLIKTEILQTITSSDCLDIDLKPLEGRIGKHTSTQGKFISCSYTLQAISRSSCTINEASLPFQLNYSIKEQDAQRYSIPWKPKTVKCQLIEEGYSYEEAQSFYNSNYDCLDVNL